MNTQPAQDDDAALQALEARAVSGGRWFYWIAGLSLVNSITALLSIPGAFVMGLCITQLLDLFSGELKNPTVTAVLFCISLVIIGIYVLFGVFAVRLHVWAFVTGLVFYALDTLILLPEILSGNSGVIFSVVFHIWAIVGLVGGLKAANQLKKIKADLARQASLTGQQPYYQPPIDPTHPGTPV